MNEPHRFNQAADRRDRGRKRQRAGSGRLHSVPLTSIPLTETGVPAAMPDGPKPSPVVSVSTESRARYPWLPHRVIAGSVWRGPNHERVRVDEAGHAA